MGVIKPLFASLCIFVPAFVFKLLLGIQYIRFQDMSGIEIAGLALAVLPLVINQLDNYVQGLETLGDFRIKRYRSRLDQYASNLGSQQAAFINTLERSLEGVIEYADGFDNLGQDELKAIWERPSVQSFLQKKLGRNYTPFLRTMGQLSVLLKELYRKLGWDEIPAEVRSLPWLLNLETEDHLGVCGC